MSSKHPFIALTLVAAALALSACSRPAPTEEPIRAVKVVTVGLDGMHAGSEYAGEVRAQIESRLGFRVGGKIVRRQAELGQQVRVGAVLAQLDPQDYQLAATAAKAQVNAAQTNRDLAAADFKRYKDLRDKNFISSAELERRDATLKAAQAQLDQALAQGSAQGHQAAYTTLVADVAGVVTAVEAEPGQVVAAGTPVVRIAQDGPRDVVFSVPEDKVVRVKVGSEVDVRAWGTNGVIKGTVREVAASADPVTRTFAVKATLPVDDALALGSTVAVLPLALDRSGAQVVKLPTSAFRQDGQSSAVWVLDTASMTVKLQPVVIATADGNEVVVSSGLQPGMQVVTAGVHVLSPGQKVSIYKEKQPLALANTTQRTTKVVANAVTTSGPVVAASNAAGK
ncbi:efflux RND transporter periplasmic adaptor subunit [Candidatus Aalborgicola defluviihabitans]|jgi:RND family efflux transporter MFP subunit|uniref:efflux RND transporter periplasmic adaptor subunit n=1 Tax=Candidatus Aalborgicola defluviihabitans TaxID=3386187 RepID=UPI001DBDC10F|nr:efflux RND transporter periplasmic adaptor subunit [Burkholderiales bacterium]MBK6568986.1 efflux RND transporter periplasmic adaptor subunit [Burkholderiales bacterium]MBK7313629.1 efflux RND transporter periplasmic adaptor subunit [Burkholderiales bacterium]